MISCFIDTPLGIAQIIGNSEGILAITIQDNGEISNVIPKLLSSAVEQLQSYFRGELLHFDLKLKPQGTEFQLRVWQELMKIPYGKTISYLELSKRLGDVKAIRAVASANGKNPLWIVIPCHRVLGTNGSLTGYAGGLWRKKWLLEHESPTGQQTLF
jgi:methylated-DNA-[protein]-cysteine S-methyltransferase